MKGATLLSLDLEFFSEVVSILVRDGATYTADGRVLQLVDSDGRYLTMFGTERAEYAVEFLVDSPTPADEGVQIPDMSRAVVCSVECRWEDLFARVVQRIATQLSQPMWVLDSWNVVWNAATVDPARVGL
jgi:hypothetical protein